MAGYTINESALEAQRSEGDTASIRIAIDASCGCERLEQRVIRFGTGRSRERAPGDRQELLYIAAGSGTLHVNGEPHGLEPDMGVYLVPGDRYTVENPGPGELTAVSVTAPPEASASGGHGVTVRYADQPVLPGEPEPRVSLSRRQERRLPRRDPVRRDHPARTGRPAQSRLR